MNTLEQRIFDLAYPICQALNVTLVRVEIVKEGGAEIVRVLIDKSEGISIDDTSIVSEALSRELDRIDPIPGAYYLEVSSLGIERELVTRSDIEGAIGKYVAIKTYEKITIPGGATKELEGTLLAFDGESITLNAKIKQFKKEITIPYPLVAKIRLAIEF